MAATVNDTMYSGDTLQAAVTVVDGDGNAVALANAAATYVIAPDATGSALVTKTEADGIALAGSTATITLDPADTAALAGVYHHEMQITDSAGNVSTVFAGALTIKADAA